MNEPGTGPGRHSAQVAGRWARAEAVAQSRPLQTTRPSTRRPSPRWRPSSTICASAVDDPASSADAEHDPARAGRSPDGPRRPAPIDPGTTVAAALVHAPPRTGLPGPAARAPGGDPRRLECRPGLGRRSSTTPRSATRQELHVHLATGLGIAASAQFDLDTGSAGLRRPPGARRPDDGGGGRTGRTTSAQNGWRRTAPSSTRHVADLVAVIETVDSGRTGSNTRCTLSDSKRPNPTT